MKTNANDCVSACLSNNEKWLPGHGPLTKREYFAAMAMQGLASWEHNKGRMLCDRTDIPWEAVQLADALIKQLNKETK